jgi:hypothetical protein
MKKVTLTLGNLFFPKCIVVEQWVIKNSFEVLISHIWTNTLKFKHNAM